MYIVRLCDRAKVFVYEKNKILTSVQKLTQNNKHNIKIRITWYSGKLLAKPKMISEPTLKRQYYDVETLANFTKIYFCFRFP